MSTDQYLIKNLSTALKSDQPAEIQRAFIEYLKGGDDTVPTTNPNELRGGASAEDNELSNAVCLAGADAGKCAQLIEKCISGNDECIDTFQQLSDNIATGVVFNSNADIKYIEKLLVKLGINKSEPLSLWIQGIKTKNSEAGEKIDRNENLKRILNTFIYKVNNPSAKTDEILENLRSLTGNPKGLPIPFKNCPTSKPIIAYDQIPKRGGSSGLTGGGAVYEEQPYNTYVRYFDGISDVINMVGGSHYADIYAHLEALRRQLNADLNNLGKKVQSEDNDAINRLLETIRQTEEKLNTLARYKSRIEALKNPKNFPDFTDFNAYNTFGDSILEAIFNNNLTKDMIDELERKYNEVREKYLKQTTSFVSILEQLYKALGPGPIPGKPNDTIQNRQKEIQNLFRQMSGLPKL